MSDQENNEIFRPLEKLIKRPNPVPYKKFVVPMPKAVSYTHLTLPTIA